MRLKFHTRYDRWRAGETHDVPGHLADSLIGDFADLVEPTVEEVEAEFRYRNLQHWAKLVGVDATLKRDEMKAALVEAVSGEGGEDGA